MPSFVIRQNLSVKDRDIYYSSLWSGSHASSFSSSQARGWLTDMELVGKDRQTSAWTRVKVHKAVICPVLPVLHNFLHEMSEPAPCFIFPDVPHKVLSSLVQLVYTGECQLSPETDLPSLLNLANDLGFHIHPNVFQFKAKPSDSQNKCAEVNFKGAVSSRNSLINVGNNLQSISVGNDSADEVKDKIPLSSNAGSGDHSTFHAEVNDINDNVMRKTGKSDVPKYNCEYCEFKSKYWNSLKMHSDEHHKNKNFKCKKCDFESTNLLNIKNHNKHMHIGEGNLVCKNCGFRATSVRKMTWHENRVHKKVTRLFKEGKKANSDSGDHPNPTSTEIKNTNKSKVKQIGKTKSGIAATILDAKSVLQESPSKSKKVLRANDGEILSETSSLYMDILNTRLDKEDLSTKVKTEKKITPTPKSTREKVQVIYEADGAQVVRNFEDRESSSDKDIDALLKDAAVLLEECPEEAYYQAFAKPAYQDKETAR